MATTQNGQANGHSNGATSVAILSKRFTDIPSAIDIPVDGLEGDEQAVEVNLEDLLDDPTELCTLLENEKATRTYWMTISLAYAKQKKADHAIEIILKGLGTLGAESKNPANAKESGQERLGFLSCLCWLYLWKSRDAPRVAPGGTLLSEAKTKEYYLQQATTTLNEASRFNPAFPPLFLARGVLYLLRASLQPPSKSANPSTVDPEKVDLLRSALKSFDDALRTSKGRNMMAVLGKSRAQFSLGKYAEALDGYQEVLHKMPDLTEPDPRIGIGCCFWQLGFKEDAKAAWERALEINPTSKIANLLLGIFYLYSSAQVPLDSTEFMTLYKKGMTEYCQKAFKADRNQPLTAMTFAGYFLTRKSLENADLLAHKAIQYTDVNAIASDGWYLLARKEHLVGDLEKANDYYGRADQARGGVERGYLPAKFGAAQLSVVKGDFGEAKLRLEKIIQQSKNVEAMVLLGTLYAEEVFATQYSNTKEDKSTEYKKAVGYLENARMAWKDTKKNISPDASVLLNLARLYETDQPERSLQCLQQVEQMELDQVPEEEKPKDIEDEATLRATIRSNLPPQLLNNMGCFHYQAERFDQAREMFQAALSACVKVGEKQEGMDTDALVTTISYNLGRTYEANGLLDEANTVYNGLLSRHDDYTDAKTRLAYISLRQNPTDEGPKAVSKLYSESSSDLEVRALYGWYLGRIHSRKRSPNIAEDPELRHYKHTLQNYEKHDRYALIGMGNLYLMTAREMRRESDSDKKKRSDTYSKAVEFFDKALQLDPKNAFAAQGIAIALVEDKKDFKTALGIFVKVRDTVREPIVYVNLGHIFAELRQYSKAIEHYELALAKDRAHDAQILACLGRTWLAKGRAEKSFQAYKNALDYSQKALEVAPEQIHFKFNIAFVQIQLATTIYNLPEAQRTLAEVQSAADGLEQAIESLEAIAQHPQTPYPKHDVEQRANMARNTMRRQLERSIQAQKEYEEKNAEKLAAAREERERELKKREEAKIAAEEAVAARKRAVAEERQKIQERDRLLAEQRAEESRQREEAEYTTDEETGDRVKRKKAPKARGGGGKRKKKEGDDTGDEDSGADFIEGKSAGRRKSRKDKSGDEDGEDKPKTKKRKLARKNGTAATSLSKYKSSEIVVESDSDGDDGAADAKAEMNDEPEGEGDLFGGGGMDVDEEEEEVARVVRQNRRKRIAEDDDDEDEDEEPAAPKEVEEPVADTSMADANEDEDDE